MKKFYKVLSAAALGAIFATGVVATASCGENKNSQQNTSTLDSAVKMLEASITNNGDKISSDFELPATITEYGKTYDIAWVSDNADILNFKVMYREDGTKYVKTMITRAEDEEGKDPNPDYEVATYHAVLTDRDSKQTKNSSDFRVRILKVVPASVTFAKWIDGSETQFEVEGYVLAKLGYNESYKEANIIVWDDEAQGAYFIYQCYLDKDVYDSLEGGEKVSVTNVTRNPYNGLIESKYGATATVDKNVDKFDISKLGTDITSLVKDANTNALMKLQSSKVSLKQVKVVSKNEKVDTTDGKFDTTMTTVVTVGVGEETLDVALYQGFTAFSADSTKTLVEKLQSKVGGYVNLEGYLSWDSNGPVFIINDASKIEDTTEPADGKVQADLDAVASTIRNNYGSDATVTLPAEGTVNKSALTYAVSGDGATLADNVLTLKAGTTESIVKLTITGKIGDTKLTKEVTIRLGVTDETIAKEVADAYTFDITTAVSRIALSDNDKESGVTFTWAVKDSADGVAEIKDGKLYLIATNSEKKPVITLTAKYYDATVTRDIEITVPAYTLTDLSKVAEGKDNSGNALTVNKSYVVVEGYVSQAMDSKNNWYISTTNNTDKTLLIYYVQDNYGTKVTTVNDLYPVGTKVTLWGLYTEYNSTKELKNAVVLKYEETDDSKANGKLNAASKLFASEYNEKSEITLPEGVTAVVTAGTSAKVANGKLTITPTATSEEVSVKLTATSGTVNKESTIKFTSVLSTSTKTTVTVKTVTENKNLTDSDVTSLFNVDDKITISYAKNESSNDAAISTSGELRLYKADSGNGNAITITVKGYTIKSITLTYTDSKYTNATVSGATNTADATALTAKFTTTGESVTIQNKKTDNQVRISSIVVEYDVK